MRLLGIAMLVALAGAAHADSDGSDARELYQKGMAHYDLGDYAQAVAEFKHAYELTRAPRLLFDIAQAQRLEHRYDDALDSYVSYLRLEPDAPNRVDVAARIAELSRLLREQSAQPPPVEHAPSPPDAVAAPAPTRTPAGPPPTRRSRALIVGGAIAASAGLALVGGAIAATTVAASDGATLAELKQTNGVWTTRAQSLYDQGKQDQIAAAVLWSVGGAALVAGGVTALLGAHRTSVRVGALAGPSGASVSLGGELP